MTPGDPAFDAFVAERSLPLLRTAYLLAGDRAGALDLLQRSLVAVRREPALLADPARAVAVVRRELVAGHTGWRRRIWLGDLLAGSPLMSSVSGLPGFAPQAGAGEPRDPTTAALALLPPPARAALVLRLGDGLSEAATAEALRRPVEDVAALVGQGLGRLRGPLGADDDRESEEQLRRDLAVRGAQVTGVPDGLAAQVADADRSGRTHRTALLALVAVVLAVVVLVAVTV
ncbi:hypothetical protein [Modestobacter versicolor]|uniref:hypothetical protein n=1 Tax=Modestobacter versicolor TaxID=429133 RepID=UPI0034DF1AE3